MTKLPIYVNFSVAYHYNPVVPRDMIYYWPYIYGEIDENELHALSLPFYNPTDIHTVYQLFAIDLTYGAYASPNIRLSYWDGGYHPTPSPPNFVSYFFNAIPETTDGMDHLERHTLLYNNYGGQGCAGVNFYSIAGFFPRLAPWEYTDTAIKWRPQIDSAFPYTNIFIYNQRIAYLEPHPIPQKLYCYGYPMQKLCFWFNGYPPEIPETEDSCFTAHYATAMRLWFGVWYNTQPEPGGEYPIIPPVPPPPKPPHPGITILPPGGNGFGIGDGDPIASVARLLSFDVFRLG